MRRLVLPQLPVSQVLGFDLPNQFFTESLEGSLERAFGLLSVWLEGFALIPPWFERVPY